MLKLLHLLLESYNDADLQTLAARVKLLDGAVATFQGRFFIVQAQALNLVLQHLLLVLWGVKLPLRHHLRWPVKVTDLGLGLQFALAEADHLFEMLLLVYDAIL